MKLRGVAKVINVAAFVNRNYRSISVADVMSATGCYLQYFNKIGIIKRQPQKTLRSHMLRKQKQLKPAVC